MKQTQSKSSSLGLGLFISKEIVTAHGGKIYVTSTKDDGTMFVVWLPRKAQVKELATKYN
jgi:signal transduction histidine kinase